MENLDGILEIAMIVLLIVNVWLIIKFINLCSFVSDIECNQRKIMNILNKILDKS